MNGTIRQLERHHTSSNPRYPFCHAATIVEFAAGVLLAARDGRIVLVCNPVQERCTPLSVLVSGENGETWPRRLDLESNPGEYSYPSVIQAEDGRVHVAATHRRVQIFHSVLDLGEL